MDEQAQIRLQLTRAKEALTLRDYEAAHEAFSRAIYAVEEEEGSRLMESAQIAELYLNRGAALWNSEARTIGTDRDVFMQVLQDFEQAIELQPQKMPYYMVRGQFYLEARFERFLTEAKEDFESVLRREPNHPDALRLMGEILTEEGDLTAAIQSFTQSIEAEEGGEAYFLRGLARVRRMPPDYARAAQDFGQAIRLLPQMDALYLWRAQALQEIDDLPGARVAYDELIRQSPTAEHLTERGTFLLEIDPDAAMADLDRAIGLKILPQALNNRAYLLRTQGNYDEAIADAEQALKVQPDFLTAHVTLAEVYAAKGEANQVHIHLKRAGKALPPETMQEPVFQPYLAETWFRDLFMGTQG